MTVEESDPMTKAGLSRQSRLGNPTRHLHWFAAAFGVTASAACAGFLMTNPIGTPRALGDAAASWGAVDHIPGVSGTTYGVAAKDAQPDQIIDPAAKPAQPVAWNEVDTPGCLTVTTDSGQKLSFRISGYRAPKDAAPEEPVKIDLAVKACTQSSNQVVNAVFEPDAAETGVKRDLAAREL
jgi:hypothetical protein